MSLTIFPNLDQARAVLMARRHAPEPELAESVWQRTREVVPAARSPQEAVAIIVEEVRRLGDEAVRRYTLAFDGVQVDDLVVPQVEIEAAAATVPSELRSALELAAEQVRRFHERARRNSWLDLQPDGAVGQLIQPLESVGVYAPGGRAVYPSTVIMAAVPAKVAGVPRVVLASPPSAEGKVAEALLAAARIAGVDAVYRVGGAQGIAALAFGTQSIPRVEKVVGPGNVFVTMAKRLLYGSVGIEGLAGPTECLIIADETARPAWVAADLVAQAEHDPDASPILVCTSQAMLASVLAVLDGLIDSAPRREVIREALSRQGIAVVADSVEAALAFSNEFAPEHLALSVRDPWTHLSQVRNAGGVFLGESSAESIGDYTAGPSHVMPTGGTARFASPLGLDDFVKVTSVFALGSREIQRLGPPAAVIARAEGLEAHARAIEARLEAVDGD